METITGTGHISLFGTISFCVFLALAAFGCSEHNNVDYKQQADDEVYSIVDEKWEDGYGTRVNYRVSDVEAGPSDLQINKISLPSGILTLPDAVAIATTHNRQYQTEKENLYNTALDLTLVRHEFEPNWFGGGNAGIGKDGKDTAAAGKVNAGFNQLLADGTRISTSVAVAWAHMISGDVKTGLSAMFSAVITKPLLRGSQRKFVLEGLTQAERDAMYQVRTFNRFRKEFVVSVITSYYRILEQADSVNNAKDNHDRLAKIYDQMKIRVDLGRFPQHEFEQANQDVLQAKTKYLQEQKRYERLLDEFKVFLALPSTMELKLDDGELRTLVRAGLPEPNFTEDEAVDAALEQRLDLMNKYDMIVDAERKVELALDRIRAELNLVAGGDAASSEVTSFVTVNDLGRNSLVGLDLDTIDSSGLLGIEFDLPLDRKAEKVAFRKSLLALNQVKRDHEETSAQIILQVRQAYRDLTEAAGIYNVELKNKKLAQERFENASLLLQYDRASTRDVLDAQEDFFDAQDRATTALVGYTIATLNFYRDSGILRVKPDGMWQTTLERRTKRQQRTEVITSQPERKGPSSIDVVDVLESEAPAEKGDAAAKPVNSKFIDQWMNRRKNSSRQ